MQEKFFLWLPLLIQIIGGIFIVFKVGRYTGNAEATFKNLAKEQENDRKEMQQHFQDDKESFKELNKGMLEIVKVVINGRQN